MIATNAAAATSRAAHAPVTAARTAAGATEARAQRQAQSVVAAASLKPRALFREFARSDRRPATATTTMTGATSSGNRLRRTLSRGCFPHEFSWLLDNPVRRLFVAPEELADRLPIIHGARVLEIGPGSGYFSGEFARRLQCGRLELFDIQPQMLAKAKRKLEAQGFQNIGYTQGDASADLPFPEGHFDLAVLVTVLGEVPDKVACIKAVHRVLRADGIFAVHEHLPDPDFVSFEKLRSTVEGYGFVFHQRWGRWWNYTATFQKSA